MSDEERNVSVSALRAQIQEKLALNGINGGKSNGGISLSVNTTNKNEEDPQPVPPHSPKMPEVAPPTGKPTEIDKPPRPPPPPLQITKIEALRRFNGPLSAKPPIAPKPTDVRKLSTPSIVVDTTSDCDSNFHREGSVRAKAQELEKLGLVFVRNSVCSTVSDGTASSERPLSVISSTSAHSEMSDSESDDGRPPELLRTMGLDILTAGKMGIRRPSAVCFNGDSGMHDRIMDELKRQGVVRASNHQGIYKKKTETESPRTRRMNHNSEREQSPTVRKEPNDGEIPKEIGRMREDKKVRQPEVTLSTASTSTSHSEESRDADRSSCITVTSHEEAHEQEVRDYSTGDPDKDKRLKKLHYAANEFYTVQKSFVKYLIDMERVYPNYVQEFGKRLERNLLAPPPGHPIHPVRELQQQFSILLNFHETVLLKEFTEQYASWDSQTPRMSSVLLRYADFLKICIPFLKVKTKLVEELTRLREENRDFDNATVAFEQKIFNRGVGAVVQQLDQVHQNFMRYKILMISYQSYLPKDSEEYKDAGDAILKLEMIAQKVNQEMGLPSNEDLSRLYDRFQTHFDVFVPGRRLIREGEVLKQTRKDSQSRYLVLFSDYFWICRVGSLSSGLFDLNRSYAIPIESVSTEGFEHEDFESQLKIKSKTKSAVLIFKTVKEAKMWEKDIRQAKDEKRRYKRRVSEAIQKERRQSSTPVLMPQPTLPEEGPGDEPERPRSADGDLTLTAVSRTQSVETPSQPSTPIEESAPFPAVPEQQTVQKGRVRRVDRDKPLWIPDESSSKCLMEGCGSVFSVFNRRHHCRNCGFLICSKCSGKAPLYKAEVPFQKQLVCPECYEKIFESYRHGSLFPDSVLVRGSDDEWRVKLVKGKSSYDLVEPRTLFVYPQNRGLKRMSFESRVKVNDDAVFNEVFVRLRDGSEIPRFAQLVDGVTLKFYKLRLDNEPCEQHVIYGFELNETQLDEGGTLFELIHRNQFQTDRREQVIIFRIQNQKSIQKWSAALHNALDQAKEAV